MPARVVHLPPKHPPTAPTTPPALPELDGPRPAYMPRIPWRLLAVCALGAVAAAALGAYNDHVAVDAAQRRILGMHANRVGPDVEPHLALRPVLAALARRSLELTPTSAAASPLSSLEAYRDRVGLYGRIGHDADPHAPLASLVPTSTGVARCLGLEADSLRSYLPRARALLVDPPRAALATRDVPRLAVLEHELAGRVERDRERVHRGVRAPFLLLGVERDADASTVDLYLWDVPKQSLVAAARGSGAGGGVLLTARLPGAPRESSPPIHARMANDCSLAAALKARLGQRVPEVRASLPAATPKLAAGG